MVADGYDDDLVQLFVVLPCFELFPFGESNIRLKKILPKGA
jgi:hypothetical protein